MYANSANHRHVQDHRHIGGGFRRFPGIVAAWVCVVPGLLWAAPSTGKTAPEIKPVAYNTGRETARLANQAIAESSGLACSRTTPGVFWTHNDSGDQARLFAFNPHQPRVIKMPARAQGESVCYGADGLTIYLPSEKIPTPLLEVTPANP